jgi:hypothetical protein
MHSSLARTEYNIRRATLARLDLEALPPDLQDFAARMLSTIHDAAHGMPGAVERLREIEGQFGRKSPDPYQSERRAVLHHIQKGLPALNAWLAERNIPRATMLIHMLSGIDPAFANLPLAFVENMLVKERSKYRLAARLSVECDAFGDGADGIDLAKKRFTASVNEPSRKKEHARK